MNTVDHTRQKKLYGMLTMVQERYKKNSRNALGEEKKPRQSCSRDEKEVRLAQDDREDGVESESKATLGRSLLLVR